MARSRILLTNEGEEAIDFFLRELSAGLFTDPEQIDQSQLTTLPDPHTPPLDWAKRYRSIDDRPFTLDLVEVQGKFMSFVPLAQIYNDDHPYIVIQKPAQRGVSELAITKACHALDIGDRYWQTGKRGLNVGYLFPTKVHVQDFSKERFTGLITETEYLGTLFSGTGGLRGFDDVTFKQARYSYLYLRGTESTVGVKSFPVDFLVLDEYDEMNLKSVALAEKRLIASLVNRRLILSTPIEPGKGINGLYLKSDQHVWETPCIECGRYNQLDFFRDVFCNGVPYDDWQHFDEEKLRVASYTVRCPNCSKNIPDDLRFTEGRWVALRPDITGIRGYLVPSLCFPSCKLNELAVHATSPNPTVLEEFFRSDLGIPYQVADSCVTHEMLKQLSHELDRGENPAGPWHTTTMGIDVGRRLHIKITSTGPGGFRYTRFMGTVKSDAEKSMWDYADELMKEYKVRRVVVDAAPEWDACERWAKKHIGIVFRAIYLVGRHALKGSTFKITATEEEKKKAKESKKRGGTGKLIEDLIHINRTAAMDAVFAIISRCEERWPASVHDDKEVVQQMTSPVRVIEVDDEGQEWPSWVHKARDDFYHSCVYEFVAYNSLPYTQRTPVGAGVSIAGSVKGW
jgi:phage terminase large subunit GpA